MRRRQIFAALQQSEQEIEIPIIEDKQEKIQKCPVCGKVIIRGMSGHMKSHK